MGISKLFEQRASLLSFRLYEGVRVRLWPVEAENASGSVEDNSAPPLVSTGGVVPQGPDKGKQRATSCPRATVWRPLV